MNYLRFIETVDSHVVTDTAFYRGTAGSVAKPTIRDMVTGLLPWTLCGDAARDVLDGLRTVTNTAEQCIHEVQILKVSWRALWRLEG